MKMKEIGTGGARPWRPLRSANVIESLQQESPHVGHLDYVWLDRRRTGLFNAGNFAIVRGITKSVATELNVLKLGLEFITSNLCHRMRGLTESEINAMVSFPNVTKLITNDYILTCVEHVVISSSDLLESLEVKIFCLYVPWN